MLDVKYLILDIRIGIKMKEFKLPDIGEGINQVTVTDILISNNKKIKA